MEQRGEARMMSGITFGKEKPYGNARKANKAERSQIVSAIRAKNYTFAGTDAITIDANNHKIIYLVDHTDGKSLEEIYDNLSREEKDECIAGYGITGKFNIDKITKNDIRRILERISSDYGHSEERIREVLQNLGIRPEILSGIDVAAELKMVSGANVVMDATGGGE